MASLTYVEGWPDRDEGPVRVEIHLQVLDGRIECVGLLIGYLLSYPEDGGGDLPVPPRSDPQSLTAEVLRKLSLPDLIGRAIEGLDDPKEEMDRADPSGTFSDSRFAQDWIAEIMPAIQQRSKRTGRKGHPPEFWVNVAAIYRQAHSERRYPTKAVAEELNVSKSTAAKYVAKARGLGILPPTTRGKPSI